jgi:hypothetical protein
VSELLLFRLVPAAARGVVGNAGKQRRPWRWSAGTVSPASSKHEEAGSRNLSRRLLSSPRSPGTKMAANGGRNQRDGAVAWSFGLLRRARLRKREKKGRCLGGLWGWCEFDGEVGASFYRPERPGAGVARGGGPATCVVQRRARRLWGLAGMRGRVLWCCHERAGVLDRAEEGQRGGGKGEGSGCFPPPFFRVSRSGPGRGEGASTAGWERGVVGYSGGARAYEGWHRLQWFSLFLKIAHQVLDLMSARN